MPVKKKIREWQAANPGLLPLSDTPATPSRIIIAGAALWFDPDTGVSASSGNVDSWTDRVLGLIGTNTGTGRPTLVTSATLNNRAALRFNQDNQQRLIGADTQHLTHSDSDFTWFFVFSPTKFNQLQTAPGYSSRQYMLYPGNDYAGAAVQRIAWAYKANANDRSVHGYSDNDTVPWKTASVHVANRPCVIAFRNSQATGGAIFRNGVKQVDGLSYVRRKFENGFALGGSFGEPAVGADTYCDGDFGDVVGYLTPLTDQQIIDQSAALMSYYAIPTWVDTPVSILPEIWLNAMSNYALVSGAVNEIGNQGTQAFDESRGLTAPSASNRGLIGSVVAGSVTYPTFEADGVDDYYTGAAYTWRWDQIADSDSFCIWAWLELDALTINSGSYNHLNHAILAQDGTGNIGLYARNINGGEAYMYSFQSSSHSAVAATVPPTGLIRIRARHDGVNLRIRVGNGAEVLSAGHTANTLGTTLLSLFRYASNATFFDGRLVELIAKMNPSAGDLTAIDAYHALKYPSVA